ncbi:LPS assembly lipoprotein LptE [Kordiimonas pumila]|uniref:LPS assembly lipoprotein LptE n=1 Tax=Kordiimonas pumila TaxID=2161677 RepID=A0ABV7D9Q4_9PROT|nr:LPS assembly lipoprotein LptE [Kordiimonas pumila]
MRIALFISCLLLAACGFKPLYEAGGSSGAMQAELEAVSVGPIPDRLGQIMRNQLLERLNVAGVEKYRLDIVLEQTSEGYGVRPDAATTEELITLKAYVQLVSLKDDSILFEDTLRARTSFDIVLSDYATVTQREDSARRLALELAERIHRRLALYFSQK